jgi:hypothetical protein
MPHKDKNQKIEPGDIVTSIIRVLQNSAVTIFWQSFDQVKKQMKVKVEIGSQYMLGILAVLVGLIFALVGIANFLDDIIGVKGFSYILVGVLVTVAGIWIGEKAKTRIRNL